MSKYGVKFREKLKKDFTLLFLALSFLCSMKWHIDYVHVRLFPRNRFSSWPPFLDIWNAFLKPSDLSRSGWSFDTILPVAILYHIRHTQAPELLVVSSVREFQEKFMFAHVSSGWHVQAVIDSLLKGRWRKWQWILMRVWIFQSRSHAYVATINWKFKQLHSSREERTSLYYFC